MVFKEVDSPSDRPAAEIEAEVQKQAQEAEVAKQEAVKIETEKQEAEKVKNRPPELKDEDVLSYFEKKGRKVSSLDELFVEQQKQEELNPTVAQLNKYIKETGRGIEDYLKLNRDYSKMEEDDLLKEYLLATEEDVDTDDLAILMRKFTFDEDVDDEEKVEDAKLLRKKTIKKANKFFDKQKEEYGKPIESMVTASKDAEDYKQYIEKSKSDKEVSDRIRDRFLKKTDEVFGDEFKGFEFDLKTKIGDKEESNKITFAPADKSELKKLQSNIYDLVGRYMDKNGEISDFKGYHKALSMMSNPDKTAQFFYEQGQAEATERIVKGQKNINMSSHPIHQTSGKGAKYREVPDKN
jgi:hypothetical protein